MTVVVTDTGPLLHLHQVEAAPLPTSSRIRREPVCWRSASRSFEMLVVP